MKIGIILGSIRKGRNGEAVANWVNEAAQQRAGAQYEIVDLADYDLDMFDSAVGPARAQGHYDNPKTQRWSDRISEFDGFIFVTPEYNHGVPGAFKNAFDLLALEWTRKAIAFISYGADGGVRAVEQWRQIVTMMEMVDVRQTVSLSMFWDFGPDGFSPLERRGQELVAVLGAVEAATAMTLAAKAIEAA